MPKEKPKRRTITMSLGAVSFKTKTTSIGGCKIDRAQYDDEEILSLFVESRMELKLEWDPAKGGEQMELHGGKIKIGTVADCNSVSVKGAEFGVSFSLKSEELDDDKRALLTHFSNRKNVKATVKRIGSLDDFTEEKEDGEE